MTDQTTDTHVGNPAKSDLVFSIVILVISVGALIWSFTYAEAVAMLLPRLAAGLGILSAVWMIIRKSRELVKQRAAAANYAPAGAVETTIDDEDDEDEVDTNDAEYVLSHTSRRDWLISLGFIAGFFVLLYLFGLFIAAGVLSLTYLIFVGKRKWWFAVIYTAVLVALLYALMRVITYIPSPAGIILVGG